MTHRPATARDRLLDTAAGLFYAEGITATAVDRIVAEAGVAKPTLYAHFHSKAGLVAAVLERRRLRQQASLEAWLAKQDEPPGERLLAVFDWLRAWHAGEGGRGCAFLNAAAELVDAGDPARGVITSYKRWLRDRLVRLAGEAGLAEPPMLGEQLLLLVEGASARMLVEGDHEAGLRARQAASVLIQAATPAGAGRSGAGA